MMTRTGTALKLGLPSFLFFIFLSAAPLSAQVEGLEMNEPSSQQEIPEASVEFITGGSTDTFTIAAGGKKSFTVRYDFPPNYYQIKNDEMLTVSFPESSPLRITNIDYPEGVEEEGVVNYYESVEIEVLAEVRENVQPGDYRTPVTASYQLCDEAGTCLFPQDYETELPVRVSGDGAAAAGGPTAGASGGISAAEVLRYLLFAFIGGILLNVMPCVLPVLSIRALNLVKQSKNDRREIFISSILYSSGIILSLLVLAAVVTALKLSGEMVGWGFQFQNPGFVVFLSAVVFVFALSLFDVYVFQPPAMGGSIQKAGEKGYLGSFFNGIIAVLLATPCTAPLLGTALGFAFSQSPAVIFGMFILVGIGFALPFLLIGVWPAAVQKLPKPGEWMNTFKELMGFILLATVLYLLSILRHQVSSEGLLRVILFLFILGFFFWIYGKIAKPTVNRKKKWIILGIFIILTVSAADRILRFESPKETQSTTTIREGWEEFEPEKLEQYRNEGKPVFVVFSAKWCTVCTMNEETVLHTESADELFEKRGIKVLYGDYTNENPLIEKWIRSYGRAGVPVYAFYPSKSESYELLPEVLTIDILRRRLR